ncbi:MAG: hypothetical protein IMW89_02860 [Ktedonobacteraceae bacterium]|nr:hypothetical protein [Ktedonobacteraceae bacterium]
MEEILCTGLVPDIPAFIGACRFPGASFVLIERLPQHVVSDEQERGSLLQFDRLARANLADSTSGRVFSQDFELRWQQDEQGYRAIYLGARREIPLLEEDSMTLTDLKVRDQPRDYYLFGEYLDENKLKNIGLKEEPGYYYYAEVRIPRLLRYPVETPARRVQLMVREYVEKASGRTQLFRFQNVVSESNTKSTTPG